MFVLVSECGVNCVCQAGKCRRAVTWLEKCGMAWSRTGLHGELALPVNIWL